jgi:hypothetical protein
VSGVAGQIEDHRHGVLAEDGAVGRRDSEDGGRFS